MNHATLAALWKEVRHLKDGDKETWLLHLMDCVDWGHITPEDAQRLTNYLNKIEGLQ